MSATNSYTEDDDTPGASLDTPITRADLLMMQVDEIDAMLANIRDRRLRRVAQLSVINLANKERATIDDLTKFEKGITRARQMLAKAEVAEQACVEAINKCRSLALNLDL